MTSVPSVPRDSAMQRLQEERAPFPQRVLRVDRHDTVGRDVGFRGDGRVLLASDIAGNPSAVSVTSTKSFAGLGGWSPYATPATAGIRSRAACQACFRCPTEVHDVEFSIAIALTDECDHASVW